MVFTDSANAKLIELITNGGVGVLLTDTLYGLVAKADNERAVERVFQIKGRTPSKPPIVLVSNTSQLYDPLPESAGAVTDKLWPGKNSIIFPSPSAPEWLVRGSKGVSYRLPDDEALRALLAQTGPLIAPSANLEGETPARTVAEAQAYFGDKVDFYVDGGEVVNDKPSNLYSWNDSGDMEQLR